MQFAALTKFIRNYEDKDRSEICMSWISNIPVKAWVNAQYENSLDIQK